MMNRKSAGLLCALGMLCYTILCAGIAHGQEAPPTPQEIPPTQPIFGVEVDPNFVTMPPDVRAEAAGRRGLRVLRVLEGSIAAQTELQSGDILYMIGDRYLESFDDVMDMLAAMRPNVQGSVHYLRGNATFIQNFTPTQSYATDYSFFGLVRQRENRFAGRFDFLGVVSMGKETSTYSLGTFKFLSPFVVEYHKIGSHESTRTLIFVKFKKGTPNPVVF